MRVLVCTMKKIGKIVGEAGAKLCDRGRSVKLRVLDIARAARSRAKQGRERLGQAYGKLLNATRENRGCVLLAPKGTGLEVFKRSGCTRV